MKGVIDRFEGDVVVVEIDGETKGFPKKSSQSSQRQGMLYLFKIMK